MVSPSPLPVFPTTTFLLLTYLCPPYSPSFSPSPPSPSPPSPPPLLPLLPLPSIPFSLSPSPLFFPSSFPLPQPPPPEHRLRSLREQPRATRFDEPPLEARERGESDAFPPPPLSLPHSTSSRWRMLAARRTEAVLKVRV